MSRAGQALRLRALDALDLLRGRRDRLVPPRRLAGRVGDSDFVATGEELAGLLVDEGGLEPDDSVLDVGCGYGRVARALTRRLGPDGRYAGFDASAEAIDWCRRRYRARPAFEFTHIDVGNATYNPDGAIAARRVEFPYPAASVDIALAASVFTHMLADGTDRYLAEAARVLRPGGRLVVTLFLLDDEARRLQREGAGAVTFLQEHWPTAVADPDEPEAAVGCDEAWVRGRLGDHGFDVVEAVRRGSWSGRADGAGFQDVIVAALP